MIQDYSYLEKIAQEDARADNETTLVVSTAGIAQRARHNMDVRIRNASQYGLPDMSIEAQDLYIVAYTRAFFALH